MQDKIILIYRTELTRNEDSQKINGNLNTVLKPRKELRFCWKRLQNMVYQFLFLPAGIQRTRRKT